MNLIRLQQVRSPFIADTQVVSAIWNQEVDLIKGDQILMVASSGTGKTTLLSYLLGDRKNFMGQIYFDQHAIQGFSKTDWATIKRKHLASVYQGLQLFPELTAWENVQLKNSIGLQQNDQYINSLFDELSLSDKRFSLVSQMSFGQQQRLAFIRSMCQEFDFLLLDEPFSHLDQQNTAILCGVIQREIKSRGAGLLISSLDDNELLPYSQKYQL